MEIKCRILYRTPSMNGISQSGNPWQKQILVCETLATYPKKVALTAFNSTVETMNQFPDGTTISAVVSVESREFNGKWYTDVYLQNAVLEQIKAPVASTMPTQVPPAVAPQMQAPMQAPMQAQMPSQMQQMQQMPQQVPQAQPYAAQPVQKQQVYPSHLQQLLDQPLPTPSRVQFSTQSVQQMQTNQYEDLPF